MAIETDEIVSRETLKKYFGFESFLNNVQEYACQKVFKGMNDIYLNQSPGDGKSLCFQLPTILKNHTLSVVFVPRDILAKDQILFLSQRGINVGYVCTRSCKKRLQNMIHSFKSKNTKKIQFLYVLVHKRITDLIKDWIVELNAQNVLSYIVFDEAHCASSLSHDYIPAYRDAAELVREICPNVCKIALTATATTEVRRDIISILGMKNVAKFRLDRERRTVYHDVCFMDTIVEPLDHLVEFIGQVITKSRHSLSQISGIIFCRKRKVVDEVAKYLRLENIPSVAYHIALSLHDRELILKKWANGEIRVIVATHTFGIGLHKPNVRFVVHWNLPMSFQQMYQESGRVSKDGAKSYCRVYYSYAEEENIMTYFNSLSTQSGESIEVVARRLKFFEEVVNYCLEVKCRHVARCKYFELIVPTCGKFCDACCDVEELRKRVSACLEYRALKKKGSADKLSYAEVEHSAEFMKSEPDCTAIKEENDTNGGPSRSIRNLLLNRLIHELMKNYKKNHQEVEKKVSKFDVTKIAIRLEYSLYNGAADKRNKYIHNVFLAVSNIEKATDSGLACIHFVEHEKHDFDPEPNKIIDRKPDIKNDVVIID